MSNIGGDMKNVVFGNIKMNRWPFLSAFIMFIHDSWGLQGATGADPRMVRIGTGPPFWQINHVKSAHFRLFLGYFRVISAIRPPLLDLGPLFLHILDPPLRQAALLCLRFKKKKIGKLKMHNFSPLSKFIDIRFQVGPKFSATAS